MVSGGVRAVARCDALGVAPYSDMEGGLFRAYLTPAYAAAQGALAGWMEEAGMSVRVDPAANLIGRYEGLIADAPPLLIGSHLDSVKDGGRYDGPLGIMLGVEAVDALHRAGKRMPFPVEVIAFGDEEGSRFPAAMLTSRAVAGVLEAEALDVVDGDGVPLEDALSLHRDASEGWHLSSPAMSAFAGMTRFLEARRAAPLAYLEAHIEQGPVLEAEGLAVGTGEGAAVGVAVGTADGTADGTGDGSEVGASVYDAAKLAAVTFWPSTKSVRCVHSHCTRPSRTPTATQPEPSKLPPSEAPADALSAYGCPSMP